MFWSPEYKYFYEKYIYSDYSLVNIMDSNMYVWVSEVSLFQLNDFGLDLTLGYG